MSRGGLGNLSEREVLILKQFLIMGPCTGAVIKKSLNIESINIFPIIHFLKVVDFNSKNWELKVRDEYVAEFLIRYG